MSTLPPAPDWALNVLDSGQDELVRLHGRRVAPASPLMLGAGAFGCVLACVDPTWVLKITLDGSEAFFATVQNEAGVFPRGVCRYLEPVTVVTPAGPAWLVCKDRVEPPTYESLYWANLHLPADLEQTADELACSRRPGAFKESLAIKARWREQQGLDAYAEMSELQQVGLAVAFAMGAWLRRQGTADPAGFTRDVAGALDVAHDVFYPAKRGVYWSYASGRACDDPAVGAAVHLLAYEWHLERLAQHSLMGPVARALRRYLDLGVLLCDAQPDNIARRKGTWALFDAGITIPLTDSWLPSWRSTLVDVTVWDARVRCERINALSRL